MKLVLVTLMLLAVVAFSRAGISRPPNHPPPNLPTRHGRSIQPELLERAERSPKRHYDPGNIGAYGPFNPKANGPRLPTRFRREMTEQAEFEEYEPREKRQIDGRPRHYQLPKSSSIGISHRF